MEENVVLVGFSDFLAEADFLLVFGLEDVLVAVALVATAVAVDGAVDQQVDFPLLTVVLLSVHQRRHGAVLHQTQFLLLQCQGGELAALQFFVFITVGFHAVVPLPVGPLYLDGFFGGCTFFLLALFLFAFFLLVVRPNVFHS